MVSGTISSFFDSGIKHQCWENGINGPTTELVVVEGLNHRQANQYCSFFCLYWDQRVVLSFFFFHIAVSVVPVFIKNVSVD